jgi:DNA-binding transcriptional LysR family regulator
MELRHLRYFVAVAEAGNLSRAAEKLFVAQPPLSLQIRQLEEELGGPLFTRHPKGMRLTPAGDALLPEARDLLERAARLKQDGGRTAEARTLALGYVPSAGSTVVPDLVRTMRNTHPSIEFRLHEMISDEQREALIGGRIDAGLARGGGRHSRMQVAAALPDPFCLAMSSTKAKGLRSTIPLGDYAADSFIAFTRHRGPAYFDRAIRLCGDAGFSPRIQYEASTLHGVLALVSADLGVALVPESAALLQVPGVALRRLQRAPRDEVLSLLMRRHETRPLLQELVVGVNSLFLALKQRVEDQLAGGQAARGASRRRR